MTKSQSHDSMIDQQLFGSFQTKSKRGRLMEHLVILEPNLCEEMRRNAKNALGGERIQDGHELSCLRQHVDPPVPQLLSLRERL